MHMSKDTGSVALSWGMVALGALALLLAFGLVLPVGVNFPESWFGVLIIVAVAGSGFALIYRGARRLLLKL